MPPEPLPSTLPASRGSRRLFLSLLIPAFTYIFLANAWLGDDAYITFRVIWNWLHGYGVVFNPGERVQAFTHPLWMLVMSAAHFVTREFFFTALAVSYGFVLATLLVVTRRADLVAATVAVAWLLSSKAFVDYTSSGLEYPLSYFLSRCSTRGCMRSATRCRTRDLRLFGLLAGLAFVNRMDSVLLYAVPLPGWRCALRATSRAHRAARSALRCRRAPGCCSRRSTTASRCLTPTTPRSRPAFPPAPLPTGPGLPAQQHQLTIPSPSAPGVRRRAGDPERHRPARRALSALLYVLYTISVGGDFMSGRFFTMPFLVAAMTLLEIGRGRDTRRPAAALVLYNLLIPLVPVKTTGNYDAGWPWRTQNGIKDERGHYHRRPTCCSSPVPQPAGHTWVREGISFRNGPDKVTVQGSIGFYGLFAGPEKHLVDATRCPIRCWRVSRLAAALFRILFRPFLPGHPGRLPRDGRERHGTGWRIRCSMPTTSSCNPVLRDPLLSAARLRSIRYLNAGAGRHLAQDYEQRRPIALSIRATNDRFPVDAGERDDAAGVIQSVGRAGLSAARARHPDEARRL